jgi:hypothetical protein
MAERISPYRRPFRVVFIGDEAECAKWLPWAKNKLFLYRRVLGSTWKKTLKPYPDVLVVITNLSTCLSTIVIIAESENRHGFFFTPMSSISPNGFGLPTANAAGGLINPPWGTPGYDINSGIDPILIPNGGVGDSYGLWGGKAFQCAMSPTKTGWKFLRGKHFVPSTASREREFSTEYGWRDRVYGGSISAIALKAQNSDFDRSIRNGSYDSYSVIGTPIAFQSHARSMWQLEYFSSPDNQAVVLRQNDFAIPLLGGLVEIVGATPSPVFKNGRKLSLTAKLGQEAKIPLDNWVSVGVKHVANDTYLILIGVLYHPISGKFQGDYIVCGAKTTDKEVFWISDLHIDSGINGEFYPLPFSFNRSGTRCSSVRFIQRIRSYTDHQGNENSVQCVDAEPVHIDFDALLNPTVSIEESSGVPYEYSYSTYTRTGSGSVDDPNISRSSTSSSTGPVIMTLAIGYDGDAEKRFLLNYSRTDDTYDEDSTKHNEQCQYFGPIFYSLSFPDQAASDIPWQGTYVAAKTKRALQKISVTVRYSIGDTELKFDYTEKNHDCWYFDGTTGVSDRWSLGINASWNSSAESPEGLLSKINANLANDPSVPFGVHAEMGLSQHLIDQGYGEDPLLQDTAYQKFFNYQDSNNQPYAIAPDVWGGAMLLATWVSTDQDTSTGGEEKLDFRIFNLLGVDLINEKIYVETLQTTHTWPQKPGEFNVLDDSSGHESTYYVMCNNEEILRS